MKPLRGVSALGALMVALVSACDGTPADPPPPPEAVTFDFDFTDDPHGWRAGFSDFPMGWEEQMELESGHLPLPAELGVDGRGLFVGATNRSDDVFMFWTGRVDGLQPDTRYRVSFEVEFATDSPAGCVGIGGPPGEAVWVKTGATVLEPEPFVSGDGEDGYWQMNVDKGNQSQEGEDARIVGDVGIEESDCLDRSWGMKALAGDELLEVTTGPTGEMWLLVGTDSGFEGRTELFYTRYMAAFEPI